MHGLEEQAKHTTPFHTFDACDGDLLEKAVSAINKARKGDEADFIEFASSSNIADLLAKEGVIKVERRADVRWDDASTAWMFSLPAKDGEMTLPEPLDIGVHRQRLGRFPYGNGSPIEYLLTFITRHDSEERLFELLASLETRFSEEAVGSQAYLSEVGGLCLKGYLKHSEVVELRGLLQKGKWSVSSNEPLDGGVRDIAKHLTIILRNAISRRVGILQRAHT